MQTIERIPSKHGEIEVREDYPNSTSIYVEWFQYGPIVRITCEMDEGGNWGPSRVSPCINLDQWTAKNRWKAEHFIECLQVALGVQQRLDEEHGVTE